MHNQHSQMPGEVSSHHHKPLSFKQTAQHEVKTFYLRTNPDIHQSGVGVTLPLALYPGDQCYLCSDGISVQLLRLEEREKNKFKTDIEMMTCHAGTPHRQDRVEPGDLVSWTAELLSDRPLMQLASNILPTPRSSFPLWLHRQQASGQLLRLYSPRLSSRLLM